MTQGGGILSRLRRWLDERRARQELLILSDAALRDLAIDRSEAASIARYGRSDVTRRSARCVRR